MRTLNIPEQMKLVYSIDDIMKMIHLQKSGNSKDNCKHLGSKHENKNIKDERNYKQPNKEDTKNEFKLIIDTINEHVIKK